MKTTHIIIFAVLIALGSLVWGVSSGTLKFDDVDPVAVLAAILSLAALAWQTEIWIESHRERVLVRWFKESEKSGTAYGSGSRSTIVIEVLSETRVPLYLADVFLERRATSTDYEIPSFGPPAAIGRHVRWKFRREGEIPLSFGDSRKHFCEEPGSKYVQKFVEAKAIWICVFSKRGRVYRKRVRDMRGALEALRDQIAAGEGTLQERMQRSIQAQDEAMKMRFASMELTETPTDETSQ